MTSLRAESSITEEYSFKEHYLSPPSETARRDARRQSVRKLKEIEEEASGIVGYLFQIAKFSLTGKLGLALIGILTLITGMAFSKIIVGWLYIHDCPIQPLIPVWLIVGAIVDVLTNFICQPRYENGVHCRIRTYSIIMWVVLVVFQFIWLIMGAIFILQSNRGIITCNALLTARHALNQTLNVTSQMTKDATATLNNTSNNTEHLRGNLEVGTLVCLTCDMNLYNFALACFSIEMFFTTLVIFVTTTCCCCYCFLKTYV